MEMTNQIYVDSKRNVEEAINTLVEREMALKYVGSIEYCKEVSEAKDKLVVLLGKIEGVHEKYPEKLLPTEVHIGNVPKDGRLNVMNGKDVKITYNLFTHKESFYIYLRDITTIKRN